MLTLIVTNFLPKKTLVVIPLPGGFMFRCLIGFFLGFLVVIESSGIAIAVKKG
jgi:hypothetical protein